MAQSPVPTLQAGTLLEHPTISDKAILPIIPRFPVPSITSVSPTSACAGQVITIKGSGFGASQGKAYLAFSDGVTNWGAPGDLAGFQINSWSDTNITFTIPEPSGPNNVWRVNPGTTATVLVAVPGYEANTLNRTQQVPIQITSPPFITNLSPSEAGPGDTVVVTGQFFGSLQQAGYLQFTNDSVNWGAPGDVAPFTLNNWSDTQIVFQIPTSSGGWHVTPGTQAAVRVTNSSGETSNAVTMTVTSGARWPITVDSGDVIVAGQGHMQTVVSVDASGGLTAMTHIWDTDDPLGFLGFMTGFHGATIITLFDSEGNQLDQWYGGPWGVEGGQSSQLTWTDQLSQNDMICAYSLSVVNFYDPQYSGPGVILAWAEANAPAIAAAAAAIVAAV